MIDKVANELIIASTVLKDNNIDNVAAALQYAPILNVNALYVAEQSGKITRDRKNGTMTIADDVVVNKLAVTSSFYDVGNPDIDLKELLQQLVRNLNSDQIDISVEELTTWLPGMSSLKIQMMVYLDDALTSYSVPDPKDKKSVYHFITLKENAKHMWGMKQFDKKNSLVKKHADASKKK